jgi:hypothetical protein
LVGWATLGEMPIGQQIVLSFFFSILLSISKFEVFKPYSNPYFEFQTPSFKINTNVNLNFVVYYIIIYFPCHLFMEGINGFIRNFLSHFPILFFHLKLEI